MPVDVLERRATKIRPERKRMFPNDHENFDVGEFLSNEPSLQGYALKLLRDRDDAEDLTQDTYIKALKHLRSHEAQNQTGRLLRHIMCRLFINIYHKRKRVTFVSYDAPFLEGSSFEEILRANDKENSEITFSKNKDPLETTKDHFSDKAYEILKGIPKKYRDPLILRGLGKGEYKDIANLLRLPIGTIKSRIHRGRKWVQEKYSLRELLKIFSD